MLYVGKTFYKNWHIEGRRSIYGPKWDIPHEFGRSSSAAGGGIFKIENILGIYENDYRNVIVSGVGGYDWICPCMAV